MLFASSNLGTPTTSLSENNRRTQLVGILWTPSVPAAKPGPRSVVGTVPTLGHHTT